MKKNLCVCVMFISCLLLGCGKFSSDKEVAKTLMGKNAYMLAIAPGQTRAAVYLTLVNSGDQPRSINLVSSSIAGYGEVHNHIHQNGVMSMRKVNHPKIAAKSTLEFAPSGYHIMLFDVVERPAAGSQIELLLEFDQAESLKVLVDVRSVH